MSDTGKLCVKYETSDDKTRKRIVSITSDYNVFDKNFSSLFCDLISWQI